MQPWCFNDRMPSAGTVRAREAMTRDFASAIFPAGSPRANELLIARQVPQMAANANDGRDERGWVRRVVNGDPDAREEFSKLVQDTIGAWCHTLARDQKAATALLDHVQNVFAAEILPPYADVDTPQPPLNMFITLKARQILAGRAIALLRQEEPDGWMFEAMFEPEIKNAIARHFRFDPQTHDDIYNEIRDKFRRNDYELILGEGGYEGSGSFTAWVMKTVKNELNNTEFTILQEREILEPRAIALLRQEEPDGWMFEAIFATEIKDAVAHYFRFDPQTHDDIYNEIRDKFRRNDYELILGERGYDGSGSLTAWVMKTVKNELINTDRKRYRPRQHEPTDIKKLAMLDRSVWDLIFRKRKVANPDVILPALGLKLVTRDEVAASIARVLKASKKPPSGALRKPVVKPMPEDETGEWEDPNPDPADSRLEFEHRERAKAAMRAVMIEQLSAQEEFCLRAVMNGLTADIVFQRMGWPPVEVHAAAASAAKKMKTALARLRSDDDRPAASGRRRKGSGPSIGNEERGS
jgi:DNA-directed RNA polymerase specialized sigma24 family protein